MELPKSYFGSRFVQPLRPSPDFTSRAPSTVVNFPVKGLLSVTARSSLHFHVVGSAKNSATVTGASELEEAIALFHRTISEQPKQHSDLNRILASIAKMRHYSTVISLYNQMAMLGIASDSYTIAIAINSFSQLGLIGFGFSLVGLLFKLGIKPVTQALSPLVKGFCKIGNLDAAMELVRKMEEGGWKLNVVTYNHLVDGLCKRGDIDAALELVSKMGDQGCEPDRYTCSILVHGLCNSGDMDAAMELIKVMKEDGLELDVVTYSTMIHGFCKAGNSDAALAMLREMKERNCKPNIITYNTLLSELCRAGRNMDAAIELVRKMENSSCKPDVFTYNTLIDGFCKLGNMDAAIMFLRKMEEEHCKPDIYTYNILMTHILRSHSKWEEVGRLWETMMRRNVKANVTTFNILVNGLCREMFFDEAMEVLVLMRKNGCPPNDRTFRTIVNALLESNDSQKAEELAQEMINISLSK